MLLPRAGMCLPSLPWPRGATGLCLAMLLLAGCGSYDSSSDTADTPKAAYDILVSHGICAHGDPALLYCLDAAGKTVYVSDPVPSQGVGLTIERGGYFLVNSDAWQVECASPATADRVAALMGGTVTRT